jgi:hypothetical protein
MNTIRSSRLAATTTIIIAVVAVGIAAATTAEAQPKKPGNHEYLNCVYANLDSINKDYNKIPLDAYLQVAENCCTDLGGIYNENTYECYLPNGETGSVSPPSPPRPSPGATVILPPGADTRVGE